MSDHAADPGTPPIRVAYLVASLRVGGAERQLLALAAGLPRDRFRPTIVAMSGPGPLDAQAAAADVPVIHLASRSVSRAALPARALGRLGKIGRYVQVARRQRFDIVDAWLHPEDVVAVLSRVVTRTPIVLSGRRDILPRDGVPVAGRLVDVAIGRMVDLVVANSAAAGAIAVETQGVPRAKVRIIRNGVALAAPLAADERAQVRRSMDAADGDLVIGCVGNLREVKRHALLLDAFAPLARERSDVRLVLVGEGPSRPELVAAVARLGLEGRVRLHGAVLDARPLYGAFDLVVQASRSEGLPNVLLEAAAAGRPIVATDAGGSGEIVIDRTTGLLVPIEDGPALTRAMRRMLDDPELRDRLAASARAHIAAGFGMDRFVRAWAELYEGALADRRPEGRPR